jgi:hypothetical protein
MDLVDPGLVPGMTPWETGRARARDDQTRVVKTGSDHSSIVGTGGMWFESP